jgi:DNA-binding CsgD family transcriptional regulator
LGEVTKQGATMILTPRELDVLQLIARGCTYSRVGDRLGVSQNTVATHIKNAYRKLEVHCAAAAVMRAMQLGLLIDQASRDPGPPGDLTCLCDSGTRFNPSVSDR